eukprot:7287022-Prymnesium_polylepis.1
MNIKKYSARRRLRRLSFDSASEDSLAEASSSRTAHKTCTLAAGRRAHVPVADHRTSLGCSKTA